jgi:hypothetical protein
MTGPTFYLNTLETATLSAKISTKNPGGTIIPVNLSGKDVHFYVKIVEQDLDEDAYIHKYVGNGITVINEATGEIEIDIDEADTQSLIEKNVTHNMYWSLRLVYSTVNRTLNEGLFVVTPA